MNTNEKIERRIKKRYNSLRTLDIQTSTDKYREPDIDGTDDAVFDNISKTTKHIEIKTKNVYHHGIRSEEYCQVSIKGGGLKHALYYGHGDDCLFTVSFRINDTIYKIYNITISNIVKLVRNAYLLNEL